MRLIISILICLVFSIVTAEDLLVADFDANNSQYSLVNGGILNSLDYFARTYDGDTAAEHIAFNSEQGTYYIVGRDIIKMTGSLINAEVILADVNVSNHSSLQVKVLLAAPSGLRYENIAFHNEDWIIGEYSYDGSNWTSFTQFTGNDPGTAGGLMAEDTDYNGIGDGTVLSDTFQEFTYNIPDGGSTLKIRFLFYGTSGTEVMAIDNIRVSGTVAGPPDAPTNLITVSVTSSEANISWDAVTGATVYHIYRSDDPYSGFAEVGTSATTAYQDTNVSAGNKYFYYVTADNSK